VTADASDATNRLLWRVPPEDVGKTVLVKGHAETAAAQTTAVATTAQSDAPAVAPAQAPPPSQAP
jgi:hypothetical protein